MTTSTTVDPIVEEINQALAKRSDKFGASLSGPVTASILKEGGTYKSQKFVGGEDFLLKGIRPGKRAQYIIEFEPFDAQGFVQMELGDKQAFEVCKGLEDVLIEILGQDAKLGWSKARSKFLKEHKQAREDAHQVEEVGKYEQNRSWGMF
ncbi:hypothetical protein SAMN05216548_11492 [Faunimonas pinastri]|uniref:Uncharacterized protein n=1 Tax=Faunimonas pinastri TaxID=1855383 RepID=A0A1H9MXP7_9HYPH|nr:hypothetical protein [Faunimonas pinastri]SER28307.1 hypothetical protein SAMN05216548_11492 [Faunimonas pinastri]